ncbi:CLUMA_CG018407, isoform A [Clunio marinus]|uniref:CLUMA_CG018407, isoform A n=1 Tax=Clunio marinus TaxID=568069 RepID=A0A1J1IXP9_9DIPT|nr:CLUMA_CG018407, isoform A [Clunio marinus]
MGFERKHISSWKHRLKQFIKKSEEDSAMRRKKKREFKMQSAVHVSIWRNITVDAGAFCLLQHNMKIKAENRKKNA